MNLSITQVSPNASFSSGTNNSAQGEHYHNNGHLPQGETEFYSLR